MSTTKTRGDIVINPNTQRPVKIGSRTWRKLVAQGVLEGVYREPEADEKADMPAGKYARKIHQRKVGGVGRTTSARKPTHTPNPVEPVSEHESVDDYMLMKEIIRDLKSLGYDLDAPPSSRRVKNTPVKRRKARPVVSEPSSSEASDSE